MSMSDSLPTLTVAPSLTNFTEKYRNDPTIRSESEAGYVVTRARFTHPKKQWVLFYHGLIQADVEALHEFFHNMNIGVDTFRWEHPMFDNRVFEVRISQPPSFRMEPRNPDRWWMYLTIEEVGGTYGYGTYGSGVYGY